MADWNEELNAMSPKLPLGTIAQMSRGGPLWIRVDLGRAFCRVLTYIRYVIDNMRVAGILHPKYNQEENATQSSASEDEELGLEKQGFDSDA